MQPEKPIPQSDLVSSQLSPSEKLLLSQHRLLLLGKLTGGLAHEIKNPLSFVNQYSKISVDLATELKQFFEERSYKFSTKENQELTETIETFLDTNNEICDSAMRIDRLIKNLLFQFQPPVIVSSVVNTVIEDNVKLAYHGMRAIDKRFNSDITYNLDPAVGVLDLWSDFSLAVLHLANNAFYSLREKKLATPTFKPNFIVTTELKPKSLIIGFHDNGLGLFEPMTDKIFEPFFTTKPDAAGLGLSFVRDIVSKHNGQIKVNGTPDTYAEFIIVLPRE